MDSNTPNIKQENAEDDKLVIPDILLDAPAGFEQSEWATLTDVIITSYNNRKYTNTCIGLG